MPSRLYQYDVRLFLLLIPLISAINYYLTYTNIHFTAYTLLTFTIDTVQGYAAWWTLRVIIRRFDRAWPYSQGPLRRIFAQVAVTTLAGLLVIIALTELANAIAKDTPVPLSFYTFDIFIIAIWFLVLNGIYTGLYFYFQWREAESRQLAAAQVREAGLPVRSGRQTLNIDFGELAGFVVDGEYTVLITREGRRHLIDDSLDKLEERVPPEWFFRLNRQCLAHRQVVRGYERAGHGKLRVLLKPVPALQAAATVSRLKAAAFRAWWEGAAVAEDGGRDEGRIGG